ITLGYDGVPVSMAHFAVDGKYIVSAHVDGTVRLWALDQGKQIRRLKLGARVSLLQVSRDGKTFLAAIGRGDSLRIKLFDATQGAVIIAFDGQQTDYIEALALSPNGKLFATSDVAGEVLLWDISKRKPIRRLSVDFSGKDALAFSPDGKT